MDPNWNDNQPIYRQLRDKVVAMILEDVLKDGDALPSVRNVAAEYRLNHFVKQLTITGAALVAKRREEHKP